MNPKDQLLAIQIPTQSNELTLPLDLIILSRISFLDISTSLHIIPCMRKMQDGNFSRLFLPHSHTWVGEDVATDLLEVWHWEWRVVRESWEWSENERV
jgi:hypothetical protein